MKRGQPSMRVLHINAVYEVGSTGTIVADIHKASQNCGIESYVVFAFSPIPIENINNGYQIGSALDKKIHAILCRINGKQGYFSRIATNKLLKYIEKIKPDIINLHNLHSNYINLNTLLKYLGEKDIKTIIVLHDCWFYTGGCFHYTVAKCTKWMEHCGNCPKKLTDTPAYLKDCSKKILADRKKYLSAINNLTVVGVSEWITREAEKTFLKNKRCVTIYNGIDFEFFKSVTSDFRKTNDLLNKFIVLGMANKWLSEINADVLATFSAKLGGDSVLLIIGCNEKQAERLPENVVTLPYISDRYQLREVYSTCDVFVNCTREESLSLVNIEAQACGTPVVTFANTGVAETVDEKSGFAVETGNTLNLLKATLEVKKHGKSSYSMACIKFVKEKFSKTENYGKYLKLYEELNK